MNEKVRSFREDFKELITKYTDQPALIVNSDLNPITITYEELSRLIDRYLAFFKQKKLEPGDTIFSLMPNAAESFVCFLATIKGGYGFAPLPCTASQREVERWVKIVKPKICFTTNLIGDDAKYVIEKHNLHTVQLETNAKFDWLPEKDKDLVLGDDPLIYLSTSGTTGEPKAMVLNANRVWSSGYAFMEFHKLHDSHIRFWNYLPMSYLGGLFNLGLIPLSVGGSIVIDEIFSGKTFLKFWQMVDRFDINAVWFVPTIVRGLLTMAKRVDCSERKSQGQKIKISFLGTAPIDLETKQEFENVFNMQLLENFALSETTFFTTETKEDIKKRTKSSMGKTLPYTDLKFVPAQLEVDKKGFVPMEIYVKSPYLFLGYLNEDGVLQSSLDNEGYFPTGDFGHLNEDDLLIIDGRERDIIKKGGYFVPLREVEVLAEQHRFIKEAASVKVPHDFYGESFILYVISEEVSTDNIKDEISQYIHNNIVKYKWPEKIIFKKDFPRTPSGKVQKYLLKEV